MTQTFTQFNGEPQFTAQSHSRPFRVDIAQFYITNVCNLTCRDCISFNNLRFQGHLGWEASRQRVEQWARLLDIDYLCIIGGEPMANPELPLWVENVRRLWPQTQREFSIVTNGTYLRGWDQDQLKDWMEQAVTIEVSVHDPQQWPDMICWAQEICSDLGVSWHLNIDYRDGVLTHNYHVGSQRIIALGQHWLFMPSAQRRVHAQGLELWDNDANLAHQRCPARDCHYFVDGIMYKCPLTAVAQALTEQFDMPDWQRELLKKSRGVDPLKVSDLSRWFNTLDLAVPQCRLCPTTWTDRENPMISARSPIWPLSKKKPEVARISLDSLAKRQALPASPGDVAALPEPNTQA